MGNFGVNTFGSWPSFEAQDDPLALVGSQPTSFGLTPFAYGATSGSGSEAVGLWNWRPPGTSIVLQSEPTPWWLFGEEPDPNTPWLHVRPPDGPPGFHVAPDDTVASGPMGNGAALGLDRQVRNVDLPFVSGPIAQHASRLTDQLADTQAGWSRPLGQGEGPDSRPGLRWPWLSAEATEEPPGFGVAPDRLVASGQTGTGRALGPDRQTPNVGPTAPFVGGLFAQQAWPLTETSLEAQPWWLRPLGQGEGPGGRSDLRWPWLRAEPTDGPLGSGANPGGVGDQSNPDEFNPLSFAYQPFDQMPPENPGVEGIDQPQAGVAPTPLNPSPQPSGVDGHTAASMALPAASVVAGSEAVGAALAEAAALAGRLAPAARAALGPAAALSVLVTPANSQGETIELGDGLRARTSPGQRSVKIERRVDNGLLGTGIGARWETLPVDGELRVEESGAGRILIDHQQLQAAVGPEATARALAIGTAMTRPPEKKAAASQPTVDRTDRLGHTPDPDDDRKPPSWPDVVISTGKLAGKILEQVNRPRSEAEVEAEIAQECRSVMRARGEQTPDKRYREKDGYETAIGVRMHPLLPDPTPGRDFYPKDANHLKGYIGEAELANLVQALGNHFVVHFGNAPGVQGPDVLSIGRDGRFMEWDSKARSAQRSVGPSMVASGSLKLEVLQAYVAREIASGRLPPELGYHALREFENGNYNICTVGTSNAHDGYVETIRNRKSSGPRRP